MSTASPHKRAMLERERIANQRKHWVRLVTACNHSCLFCLDADTPRDVFLPEEQIRTELDRGRVELGAERVILSGGEASLHPRFVEIVRYAKSSGYERVQCVTNGWLFADRGFYESVVAAGMGELTFSLHGNTEALHDELCQTKGAFKRICKAIVRAVRDPRLIANVDVVINAMNVGVIDKIVELAISLGIREFDLLHIIPQANAYENRDRMFYDVREHLPKLQKVFRLNRHPGFHIWTNRFPVAYLEGLEDLIQDPHKMLDEVNGRRYHVRRYIDTGETMDCREADRCKHCFIEPFCTTMDRVIAGQHAQSWQIWWVGAGSELPPPPGATHLGVQLPDARALAALDCRGLAPYALLDEPGDVAPREDLILMATTAAHLEAWIDEPHRLIIHLDRNTGPWMLEHRDRLVAALDRVQIHQPSHEFLSGAAERDLRDPAAFFESLNLPIRVSGLPACLAPGTTLIDEPSVLPAAIFDAETGRLHWKELARYHVVNNYRAKSVRCADCRLFDRCEGLHVNMIRDQGLALATPLTKGSWADNAEAQLLKRWPEPPSRVATGRDLEAVAASLPGFAEPTGAELDPLAVIGEEQLARKAAKLARARKVT